MSDKTFVEAIWNTTPAGLDDPSGCVQGHASFDSDRGIDLEIPLGTLLHHEPVNGVIMYGVEPLEADYVYGIDQKGSYVILTNVFETHRSRTYPGFDCQVLHGHEMMLAKKPFSPNPPIVSFSFAMVGLREWVGISPTRRCAKYGGNGNHLDELTVKFASSDIPDVVLFDKDGVRVSVDCSFTDKGGRIPQFEYGFVTDYRVTISFDEPLALEKALESWVYPVRKFLAFCMGFYGNVSSMSFCTVDGVHADYYVALVEGGEPARSDYNSMPLRWQRCSHRISSMLETWLGFEGRLKI